MAFALVAGTTLPVPVPSRWCRYSWLVFCDLTLQRKKCVVILQRAVCVLVQYPKFEKIYIFWKKDTQHHMTHSSTHPKMFFNFYTKNVRFFSRTENIWKELEPQNETTANPHLCAEMQLIIHNTGISYRNHEYKAPKLPVYYLNTELQGYSRTERWIVLFTKERGCSAKW
jgi:hypothetical protein